MNNLPTELVRVVVDNVSSTSDLLSLRSLSSAYNSLVTPSVFRRVHIKNSVQSTHHCRSILASPSLAPLVKEVVFDQRDHVQFCLLPEGRGGVCDELEITDLEKALSDVFCSLPGFANIDSLTLFFWPSFRSQHGVEVQEHPFWFTDHQATVLCAVHHAMQSCAIRSLTQNNIVLRSPAYYDFVSSLTNSPLHHFSMSVVANAELGAWSGSKALNGSLSSLLPVPSANLTSLVLRSPQGLYHSINTRLRAFHYPALQTLVLEHIVFDHTPSMDGIEEFIVRHRGTLRRLELRSCASYVPSETTPLRRWSTIWKRFDEALVSLVEIVVDGTHPSYAYALLDGVRGYVPHPSEAEASFPAAASAQTALFQEDQKHLQQLRERVTRRTMSATPCLQKSS